MKQLEEFFRITCVLIVIGILAPFSVADIVRAETFDVAEYFPLESGKTWSYTDGLNSVSRTVLAGSENVYGTATKVIQQTGGEYSGTRTNYSRSANGVFQHKEYSPNVFIDGLGFRDITVILTPPMKLVNQPATLGDFVQSNGTATYTISGFGTFTLNYSSTTRVVQFEKVVVPLYSFTAVKIQSSLTLSGNILGQYFTETVTSTEWLAQHLGVVKAENSPKTYELTSINFSPPAPAANFTANITSGVAPLTVAFSDLSTGYVDQWLWNFGDSATASTANANHSFSTPGAHTVSLTVTGLGGNDIETKTHYIRLAHPAADLNQDQIIDLHDALLALQLMARKTPFPSVISSSGISGLDSVGLAEVIYILQFLAGLR